MSQTNVYLLTQIATKAPKVALTGSAISSTTPLTFLADTDYDGMSSGFDASGSASAFNLTNGVRGVTIRVEYTPSVAITFPSACVIISGNNPVLNIMNIIYFRFVRTNRVDVTIA